MKKIAIIGATGMLGKPVAKAFINAGFEVTLLVRNPEKAKEIFGINVRYIKGDLQSIDTIKTLLKEQDNLYLNLSVETTSREKDFQAERDGLDNILEALKSSTIKRIGYLFSLVQQYQGQNGFNWWVFKLKQKAISKIKKSGISYSIFYPSTFMESFNIGGYRQGNNIAFAGKSRQKMFLISAENYEKQVVEAFQNNSNSGNQEYVIQGQEGYTADEAAKLFVENSKNEKMKMMKAPLGLLKFLGLFSNKLNYAAKINEALNNYPEKFEAEKTWRILGKPTTKLLDYVINYPRTES